MDMLGAERIPDPTTAGDFLRRFTPEQIEVLMDVVRDRDARGRQAAIEQDPEAEGVGGEASRHDAAKVRLPDALSCKGIRVAARKKLVANRKSRSLTRD